MLRYLKAAFLVGVDVPGLGRLPVNAVGAAAIGILGFAEPALWLLGLGVETAVLFALTTNQRFRRVVDSLEVKSTEHDAEQKRRELIVALPPESQRRLLELARTCARVTEMNQQTDEFIVETNRDALQRLEWVYLKLLVARNNLSVLPPGGSAGELAQKIAALEDGLRSPTLKDSLRQSKVATIAILKERIINIERRRETLDQIDSDLARIEAQVQLLLENATIQDKPGAFSTDIELASNLAGTNLYGDSGTAIADIDQTYSKKLETHERQ